MPRRPRLQVAISGAGVAGGAGETAAEAGLRGEVATALARTRALLAGRPPLPSRPDAIALAESVEAAALGDGAGARAVDLHGAAARLIERVWRVEGRPQDATEALDVYRLGARTPETSGACEAALAAARLAADTARDAATLYAELYRVTRRFPPAPGADPAETACRAQASRDLDLLAGFRAPSGSSRPSTRAWPARGPSRPALAGVLDAGTSVPVQPARLVRVESWAGVDSARVVLVLDRQAPYRVGDDVLAALGVARTFVDLDGVDLGDVARDTRQNGIVERVRVETTSTGTRAMLDLDGRVYRHVFYMQEPFRIVVDIARHPPGTGRGTRSVARVVLDAGHGGKDAGAVGPTGVREKDVTLDVARRAATVLEGQGLKVSLTRKDDSFVSLEERTAVANAASADLFVSIHCNASEGKGRHGVEVYVLDTTRDEIAARVAARENATTQAASAELASILGSMRLADDAQRSTRFAQLLERSAMAAVAMKFPDVLDGGVHTAGFYVLVGARMPGVLFETSYLSNPYEEQRLASADYRQLLADSIVNAVKAYREGR